MKISKLFHWLYASLMLLPFASVVSTTLYYSFNKNSVIPQVDKEVSKEVDFNQLLNENLDIHNIGVSTYFDNDSVYFDGTATQSAIYAVQFSNVPTIVNHKYYIRAIGYNTTFLPQIDVAYYYNGGWVDYTSLNTIITSSYSGLFPAMLLNVNVNVTYDSSFYLSLFDLTQTFGVGNEPTALEFDSWFSNDYYDYTLSEHIVIPNYETIQVADNSINHFWLPSFGAIGYNIQSYIGWLIGSVFGLNVINGIGLVIVRLFTYWLIISICWLIFDVLMYVPNLVHKWLDKAAID